MKRKRILHLILTIAFIFILPNWTKAEGFTELSYCDDAISIGTGFKNIYNDSAFHIYGNEVTLLNFAVLPEDKYNSNKCNISCLPVIFTDIVGGIGVLISGSNNNTVLSDITGKVLALPMFLANSKVHINLQPLIRNQKDFLSTTIYLRSRFDWFMLHSNAFCKYSPEIGLNFDYLQNRNPGTKGFSLSIGAIYPIDILEKKTVTNGFKFAISLNYLYGTRYFSRTCP